MINDIGLSQRSVATWFTCGVVGPLTIRPTLLQIYCLVCFERIFKIAKHLAKIWRKLIAVHRSTVLLKDEELA